MGYQVNSYSDLMPLAVTGRWTPMHHLVAGDDKIQLSHVYGSDFGEDQKYWLVGDKGTFSDFGIDNPVLVIIGYTGMVESLYTLDNGKRRALISRPDARHDFEGFNHPGSIEQLVECTYQIISHLNFDNPNLKSLFAWDYTKLMNRLNDFRELIHGEIVPDNEDNLLVIPVSYGCPLMCRDCPYSLSGGIELYTEAQIRDNISHVDSLLNKYHQGYVRRFTQAFLMASDILWFKRKNRIDPIGIANLVLESFPDLEKLSTFVGVQNVNWIQKNDPSYLSRLFGKVNRALIGIETTDDRLSYFLGKHISREEKLGAVETILRTPIQKLKMIVQVGFGQGIRLDDNTVVWSNDSIERTIRDLAPILSEANFGGFRATLEISRHQHFAGADLSREERIIPYVDPEREVTEEIMFIRKLCKEYEVDVTAIREDYEVALP